MITYQVVDTQAYAHICQRVCAYYRTSIHIYEQQAVNKLNRPWLLGMAVNVLVTQGHTYMQTTQQIYKLQSLYELLFPQMSRTGLGMLSLTTGIRQDMVQDSRLRRQD